MLKIENVKVEGFEAAIRGMRNPLNSWDKSDSYWTCVVDEESHEIVEHQFFVGKNDLDLMKRLASGGSDDAKYRRMIVVYMDITAPLYWWKEFDTYKVGTVANSCSTMHKIHAKEFTLEDFSCEHLLGREDWDPENYGEDPKNDPSLSVIDIDGHDVAFSPKGLIQMICNTLNVYRNRFLITHDKRYWWQMIQLLPSSYNQRRTVMLNYEVLHNIYHARKNHKLDEWHVLCDQIEDLPYSEVITGEEKVPELLTKMFNIKGDDIPNIHESNLTFVFDKCEDGTNFMSSVFELWEKDHLISFNQMLNKTTLIDGRCPDMRPSEWNNVGWSNVPFCEGHFDSSHAHYIIHIERPNMILSKESV